MASYNQKMSEIASPDTEPPPQRTIQSVRLAGFSSRDRELLLDAGVELYEYRPSFLHAKVAVVDDNWATVGSSNIDPFSLLLAREANVFVRNAEFADQLRQSLEAAIRNDSVAIHRKRWSNRPILDRLLTWVLYGVARGLMSVLGYGRH